MQTEPRTNSTEETGAEREGESGTAIVGTDVEAKGGKGLFRQERYFIACTLSFCGGACPLMGNAAYLVGICAVGMQTEYPHRNQTPCETASNLSPK